MGWRGEGQKTYPAIRNPDAMSAPWIITINDGYCTYKYEYIGGRGDISISEIADEVGALLRATSSHKELIKTPAHKTRPPLASNTTEQLDSPTPTQSEFIKL